MTTSNVRKQPDTRPEEIRVLPQRDVKLPLPPVRRQTRVSPGPVGVQHGGSSPAHVRGLGAIRRNVAGNALKIHPGLILQFSILFL